jgi:phospholipid transport system transporter-binding protein
MKEAQSPIKQSSGHPLTWALPDTLTHDQAADAVRRVHQAWEKATPGQGVRIQGEALKRFDSSALAVLLAIVRDAQAQGRAVQLSGLPPALHHLAQVYGVEDLL